MIQKKKKQLKIVIIILIILALIAGGIIGFLYLNKDNNNGNNVQQQEELDFKTKSLLLKTTYEIENTYGAIHVEELMENMYLLEYETEEQTKNAYEELKKDDKVEYVVPDEEYEINTNITEQIIYYKGNDGQQLASWAGTSMGLDILQDKINQKTEVPTITIAVLDSGLDLTHTIITEKYPSMISDSRYNAIDRGTDITDDNGHGTLMTGAILDCAPSNTVIIPVKVLNEEGKTEGQSLIRAINYAIEQDVDIINMSLGTQPGSSTSTGELALQDAAEEAMQAGIVVVAATGNGDEDGNAYNTDILGNEIYPAAVPDVIAVGAVKNKLLETDETGYITNEFDTYKKPSMLDLEIATFSNYGSATDFVAPGETIIGIYPISLSSSGVAISSGTSQATAHMSAAIANVLSYNKDFTNEQVYEILEYYAEDLGAEGRDVYYGNGFVNFNDMQECICSCEECDGIYCFGCTCEECVYHPVLTNIEITTNPTKTEYTEGESFDPTGMVVTAVYSDGSRVTITDYTYTPNGALNVTDTKITISYQGKTAEIEITVTAIPVQKTLDRIEVTTNPSKTEYTEGETFNPAGMVVTAIYSDDSREVIENYTYTPNGALKVADTKITISYQGKTAEIGITVTAMPVEKTLDRIEVTTNPSKTEYTEGETFNPAGMVVTAIYSDDSREVIENYTYTPNGALKVADTKITISYQGKTAEIGITVTAMPVEKTLERIEVTTKPNKTTYTEGETFNPDGMVITAIYSDGSKQDIINYNCFPVATLTTENKTITVSYTEDGKTVTTKLDIVVNAKNNNNSGNNNNDSNNNNNNNSNNNNNNGSGVVGDVTNIIQIEENNINTSDNTTKDQDLAFTGIEDYIIPAILMVTIIGACAFIKYRQYKDI